MRRIHVIMVCFLLAAMLPGTAFSQVTASIDRDSMVIDETLTLTIKKDGSSFFSSPDLEPVKKNFKVLGQSQSSSTQIINGSTTSSAEWQIVLSPRRTGKLEIPSIAVGKEKSNPLNVLVRAASTQPKTKADNRPLFIETAIDADSVYVQAQVIFTLRLYWAVEARITDPADPDIKGAVVKRLEDTQFDKRVNGQSYKVFERKYAIFPQKSGTLEIPPIPVDVMVPSQRRTGSFFDPFGMMGEKIKLRSNGEKVSVREKPDVYPASAVWLPTSSLTIDEKWSVDSQNLKVGESATISISVTADGLMGEQLPPVELPETQGLKLYQGKAEVENGTAANGISGVRRESIALIPTEAGIVELPEIRIPWWNNTLEKLEYAVVPSQQLKITGTPAGKDAGNERPVAVNSSLPVASNISPLPPVSQSKPIVWIIFCSFLGLGWAITLYLLIHTRRQVRLSERGWNQQDKGDTLQKEKKAFDALTTSCRENNPVAARKAVMSWLTVFFPDEQMRTFSDVAKRFPGSDFPGQLQELDKVLYETGTTSGEWQGSDLLEQAKKIRATRKKKSEGKEVLERLYK